MMNFLAPGLFCQVIRQNWKSIRSKIIKIDSYGSKLEQHVLEDAENQERLFYVIIKLILRQSGTHYN